MESTLTHDTFEVSFGPCCIVFCLTHEEWKKNLPLMVLYFLIFWEFDFDLSLLMAINTRDNNGWDDASPSTWGGSTPTHQVKCFFRVELS